jgi:YHS domain-containing protein
MMKRALITMIAFIALISTVSAQKSAIYAPDGIALNGYDAVAFFTQAKPVKGSSDYSFKWDGASWLFSTKANLESFKHSPEKYAPQYGGYCAYGTAQGHKAPTQADTWTIVNDKLYFNYNMKVKELWNKNRSAFIDSANNNWVLLKDKD